ncbi:olfactory receptor 6F1-like [Phyllobates terribilis]|uniref:olfactory receptor 6F1-like n=1 Tax=Phyllobates terribilis TaxID=111132 RepID=UPI003CCB726E
MEGDNERMSSSQATNSKHSESTYSGSQNASNMYFPGYTTVTVPRMLFDLVSGNMTISFKSCLTQMYFFFLFGTTEFFILALMGFDRYLAICHPLHYTNIMNKRFCYQLVFGSWVSGCMVPTVPTIVLSGKPFCGSKVINHFFCDVGPLVKLSSPDTLFLDIFVFMISAVVVLGSLLLVTVSYVFIISAIFRISSTSGRHKAFSTCASHFSVVTIFFGTVIFMYIRPSSGENFEMDKAISIFYSAVTPAMNPLIYSLRNNEVKKALLKARRTVYFTAKSFFFRDAVSLTAALLAQRPPALLLLPA